MTLLKTLTVALASLFLTHTAIAGWSANETQLGGSGFNGKETWVYTPNGSIAGNPNIINGKRALIVNLHGCLMSNENLRYDGNWEAVAEQYGAVIAVPYSGAAYPYCWDYDFGNDNSNHAAAIVNIVNALKANSSLNIDDDQVYLTGFSSGGGMAVQMACEYPHVFAGIGSVAGPSVGSDQTNEGLSNAPSFNVSRALNKCNQLANASGNAGALNTQIASLVYGDLDLNGNGTPNYNQGTYAGVDVNWVLDNAVVMRNMYNSGSFSSVVKIADNGGATADEQHSNLNGKQVVSLLGLDGVGHAWPAGDKGIQWVSGGAYVNKMGFEYPVFIMDWFFTNNRRVAGGGNGGGNGGGGNPPAFDESASATCWSHYLANRISYGGFFSCGNTNGYYSNVTLYRFGSCWTSNSSGGSCN